MRMEQWTPDAMAFARDAAEVTGYYEHLADIVSARLGASDAHVCDAGCGMGYLGAALARRYPCVYAVDRVPQVVEYARQLGMARRLNGFHAVQADIIARPADLCFCTSGDPCSNPWPYDAMIFCTTCSPERALISAAWRCTGTVIVINRVSERVDARDRGRGGRLSAQDCVGTREALDLLDVSFDYSTVELEFGQPFVTLMDAQRFFSLYRTRDYPQGIALEELARLLEPGWGPWRFYLPKTRRLSILSFTMHDVREACARRPEMARSVLGEGVYSELQLSEAIVRASRQSGVLAAGSDAA